MYVSWQEATPVAPVPLSVQVVCVKLPWPVGEAEKATVPLGVVAVPVSVSVTVAVHVVEPPVPRVAGEQDTPVLVERVATVSPEPVAVVEVTWALSPP